MFQFTDSPLKLFIRKYPDHIDIGAGLPQAIGLTSGGLCGGEQQTENNDPTFGIPGTCETLTSCCEPFNNEDLLSHIYDGCLADYNHKCCSTPGADGDCCDSLVRDCTAVDVMCSVGP
eukprot:UN06690